MNERFEISAITGGARNAAVTNLQAKPFPEIRVKRKGLLVFFLLLGVALAASESHPVSPVQLMAWLTAGVPSSRLVRIMQERGVAPVPGQDQIRQFEAAGADSDLVRALTSLHPATINSPETELPAPLLKAALDAKAQRFHEAELDLRPALTADPKNAALHFVLGNMLIRQEQWDDAFDEITLAAQLMPDLPENHSSLAYIFYRLDDGPNAIAEARTALSMDPQNAEAYQFLGLALYSNGQYAAAVHAFDESLARD
ncbi:MAG: tetratricopeptide repeat protein, partial [Candidatus Sulfotelmatobacter sp.]